MPEWRNRLIPRRRQELANLPLGQDGELPWHSSVGEVRRILRKLGALSLDIDGYPTARLRWGDMTVRSQLEFVSGVHVGEATWLADHPSAVFFTREGLKVRMEPRLRAANVHFPFRDRRGNWAKVLEVLGKPHTRNPDGSWTWSWRAMEARFSDADPQDDEATETIRFASRSTNRVVEIRNQSPLELYQRVRVRVDFREGTWEMGKAPKIVGVPLRLHWDVPEAAKLLITVTAGGREVSAEAGANASKIILTGDSAGGVRILT